MVVMNWKKYLRESGQQVSVGNFLKTAFVRDITKNMRFWALQK